LIYLPSTDLRPGMVLASDIDLGMSIFPLLTKGQVLTKPLILKILEKGIKGVYVESKISANIEVK